MSMLRGRTSSSRGISAVSFSQRCPVGITKGRMQGGWAQANITTRATQLFIKIFYFRAEKKKKHSYLEAKFLTVLNMKHRKSEIRAVLRFYQIN